ncbi:MAG: hypothetical protein OHK93_004219 [Ramalina farinacea]|uniref:Short-chain dehydrogenase n=1 Tax=Ramalina farinacea TaxID=258253 RepID=A0AA43TTA8_9LECA|nr:hypothetical protein [Ramalina farinacea]
MPDLLDKTAVITGSSSGLGRAIALLFAEHGTRLIICADLKPEGRIGGVDDDEGVPTHDLICQRHGEGRAVFKKADVSVSEDVKGLVESVVDISGRLDIIINNAGLGVEGIKIHAMEDEMFDRMM